MSGTTSKGVTPSSSMFEIQLITFCEFLVSWIVFSFSYGAICIAVEEIATGFIPFGVAFFF